MRKNEEAAGANPRTRSLRLVFEYQGREVKLVSVQRVRMMAPPPQAAVPRVGERGSWLELRNEAGEPLYRRAIDNPIRHDLEVVAEEPERPLQRVRLSRPQGTFHLVVPEIAAARSLALRAERPAKAAARKAAAAADGDVLEFQFAERIKEA